MTISDSIKKIERIDEGPGEGRYNLTLGQGAVVQTQGGSHANDWAKNHEDGNRGDEVYDIRLNSVGAAIVIRVNSAYIPEAA